MIRRYLFSYGILPLAGLVLLFSATAQAAIEWAPGSPGTSGGAVSFDGVSTTGGGLWFDTGVPTSALGSYTISAWIYQDEAVSNQWFINGFQQGIHLGVFTPGGANPTDTVRGLRHAHWGADSSGDTTVPAQTWVHAAFTFEADPLGGDTGMAQTFINGMPDSAVEAKRNPNNMNGNIVVGARHPQGTSGVGRDPWIGDVDDIAIWDSVLPAADILALANGTQTAVALSAGAYYDFEDDQNGSVAAVQGTLGSNIIDEINVADPVAEPIAGPAPGNWNVRMLQTTTDALGGGDIEVNSLTEAKDIVAFADGGTNTNGWTIGEDVSDTRGAINMSTGTGPAGSFQTNDAYPADVGQLSFTGIAEARADFIVTASTEDPLVFPEGTYAIALRTDDGGELTLSPTDGSTVAFTNETNTNGDATPAAPFDNTITFEATRGAAVPTCAEFTVPAGQTLTAHVEGIMFERGGGDSFEIVISNTVACTEPGTDADGNPIQVSLVNTTDFALLEDGALGITVDGGGGGGLACDFDGDGNCDLDDIDELYNTAAPDIGQWLTQAEDTDNLWKTDAANNPGGASTDMYVVGDVNLDGEVDSVDLGLLLVNFDNQDGLPPSVANPGQTGVGWRGGDLNADGNVNSVDLGQLLLNFNFSSAAAVSAVPEPSSFALIGIGMLGLLARRRRR